jgi:hypothetical protein
MHMLRLYMQAFMLSLQALWKALRMRLPVPSGRPPAAATAPPPDTDDTRMAVHEAGHALAAWRCTVVTHVHRASLEGRDGGFVTYDFIADPSPAHAWCKLVITLAGIAAELAVFSRARSGPAEKDLLHARKLSRLLVHACPPWSDAAAAPDLPFERLFRAPLPPGERAVLQRAYAKARALVRDSRAAHGRLTSLLLHRRTVPGDALPRVLGPRIFAEILCGLNKPTFVTRNGW